MIGLISCCIALTTFQQDGQQILKKELTVPPGSPVKLFMQGSADPLDPPHLSPKKFGANKVQWEFPWLVGGFAHVQGQTNPFDLKFLVYAQEQKGNRAFAVTQMYLRLWKFNLDRLNLIHRPEFHNGLGIVDVYLCFGGQAGGEQLLDSETGPDPKVSGKLSSYRVDTIYIYDMASFTDPVEMAREVAHEYGHASWYHFGGFKEPEEWAEGYLAEKVYLRWIRDAMAKGELTPEDAMGATKEGLDKWIAANIDPLIVKAAQVMPTSALLANPSKAGMDAFLGLALYVDTLYPDSVFARSLRMSGSYMAKDYPDGVVLAAEEPEQVTLKIPAALAHKPIWIPLGTGRVGGATVLKRDPSGWVQIQPGAGPVVVFNPR